MRQNITLIIKEPLSATDSFSKISLIYSIISGYSLVFGDS